MLTNQEIFDKVVQGIFSQGGPSFIYDKDNDAINCRYRSSSGRRCAAGWILPDEEYTEEMEGYTPEHDDCDFLWFNENTNVDFVIQLQEIHDESIRKYNKEINSDEEFFKSWIPKMIKLADKFQLDRNILNKFI